MYHTNEAYKKTVTEFPQNYRMEIEVIYDAQVEDVLETLQCEDGALLETETGEALEFPAQIAERIIIPPDDIFEAGFSENIFLSNFTVGSSVRADFWVRIFNENGKYRNDALATAEIRPRVTLYDENDEAVDTVPIGVFYVDQITVQNNDLRLGCCDKMQYLEKAFVPKGTRTYLYEIANRIAATVRSGSLGFANYASILLGSVNDSIFKGYTNRQVIELIAECCGSFAIFNPGGDLELRWFKKADVELRGDWANAALELNGNTFSLDGNVVQVTGVRVVNEDKELAREGTDEYMLTINENPIAATMPAKVAKSVLVRMRNVKYIPCKWCRIGGDPSLQLGDILTVIDNKTEYNEADYDSYDKYPLYMTARSWTFDGAFSDKYISAGNAEADLNRDRGMTTSKRIAQLAGRVTEIKKDITEGMSDRDLALLLFNENMFNSMGLYKTVSRELGKGVIIYYHDEKELENSQTIYMFGSAGFAWTTEGWNNGDPLWHYGFTSAGDSILNTINAYVVSADLIKTGLLQSKNGASWINMDDGTFCFRAVKDRWMDIDTGETEYTYEDKLSLNENGELGVYGTLRSTMYPNYSVSIGESQNEGFGSWVVSEDGVGDLMAVRSTIDKSGKGALWSVPMLADSQGSNIKGIFFLPDEITITNAGKSRVSLSAEQSVLATELANISIKKDSICMNQHVWKDGRLWFNYYAPDRGYSVKSYCFGNNDGAGGYADIYAGGVKCIKLAVGDKDFLYENQCASFHGNVSIGVGFYEGYMLSVVGTACVNGINVTSDPNLKKNIVEVNNFNALNKISNMKFYSYDYKNKNELHVDIGTMAPDAPTEIQSDDGKAIDLYAYINLTTKAVQELSEKVIQQENEITELKAEIKALRQE